MTTPPSLRHRLLPASGLTKIEAKQKQALERADVALADDAADAKEAVADARTIVGGLDKVYPDSGVSGSATAITRRPAATSSADSTMVCA